MKYIFITFLIIFSNLLIGQNIEKDINKIFINKLIEDKDKYSLISKCDTIYFFGEGEDYKYKETLIIYLDVKKVKKKVKKGIEFNLVELSDIVFLKDKISVNFNFLKAIKESKLDLKYYDNTNAFYCLKWDCNKNEYEIVWCGEML